MASSRARGSALDVSWTSSAPHRAARLPCPPPHRAVGGGGASPRRCRPLSRTFRLAGEGGQRVGVAISPTDPKRPTTPSRIRLALAISDERHRRRSPRSCPRLPVQQRALAPPKESLSSSSPREHLDSCRRLPPSLCSSSVWVRAIARWRRRGAAPPTSRHRRLGSPTSAVSRLLAGSRRRSSALADA